ncbi:DUF2911 domain-containing protein [Hymenobacter taeanensis]|uniref:DUF2911 domain-containing protein n=1 Tax=Hymenobacter taeanensis TaxID=2735321 RepID=A0A6M6BK40_9BACT|nr:MULTISPECIES: DUF2911 domain-containing protein [Hymenobacter]QJX47693.1 DUF2911 domain-containing protein [Hymenobacter taeanensis]UOQ82822.1 DUF2911 domain-containing protein [Hymenobacter sp. 5414T-23]
MIITSNLKSSRLLGSTLLVSGLLLASAAQAQISTPAASPKSTVMQRVGLTDITITYSRPGVKGRPVFGDSTTKAIVPFGQRWRTGANNTTSIKFSDDVMVEGKKVPAGEYGLYTIPGKTSWVMVLNKSTKQGADVKGFKDADDVARFTVKPYALANKVETFTIGFSDITPATANVEILWDKTGAKFKVMSDVDSKVMAQIDEKVIKNSSASANDMAAAAVYYYDNNKDLKQALTWIQKANEKDPKFWNVHTEAKIRMKMKDYKGAVTAAEQSKKLATEAKNTDYVKLNEGIIADAKKAGKM